MIQFVLTIIDDAHSILSTEGDMTQREYQEVRSAFDGWMAKGGVAVLTRARVEARRQMTVELELGEEPRADT